MASPLPTGSCLPSRANPRDLVLAFDTAIGVNSHRINRINEFRAGREKSILFALATAFQGVLDGHDRRPAWVAAPPPASSGWREAVVSRGTE